MIEVGMQAPDFELADQEGKKHKLKDYRGKKVVLYFYPKDDTSGCTKEACGFQDSMTAFRKKGIEVLGVSKDSMESHQKFTQKYKLNFTLLSDPEHKVLEAYNAWQQKSMYGRAYMGIQRSTVLIDEKGKIVKIFPKVSPEEHAKEVLEGFE